MVGICVGIDAESRKDQDVSDTGRLASMERKLCRQEKKSLRSVVTKKSPKASETAQDVEVSKLAASLSMDVNEPHDARSRMHRC